MRELKFRAYLKKEEEMYEVFSFCDKFIKVIVGLGTAWKLDINEFEPIMQFTGLKDKNGVDIYEGDILKTERNTVEIFHGRKDFTFVFSGKKDIIEVHGWLVKNKNLQIDVLDTSFCIGEVIGNIHENEELLNK
jgi:uncharacterized phage protein (TIGR01671 family)